MSAIPLTEGIDTRDALYRKITWRLLPFLTLCYMLAYLDRINIGFAKLQMQNQLAFSDAAYGVAAGIFFIGYVLFEIPSNLLLPKIGARKTLSRIMVLWGITSASMLFVRDIHAFYALRFLLGVFEAGFAPGMVLYLTYWYAPSRTARAMAVVMWAGPIGGVLGGPLSSWAMTTLAGAHCLEGWQWMFIVEGLPCCVLGVIAFFFLDDRPQQANWLSDEEKALLGADLDAQRLGRAASEARHHSLRTVVSTRAYARLQQFLRDRGDLYGEFLAAHNPEDRGCRGHDGDRPVVVRTLRCGHCRDGLALPQFRPSQRAPPP